MRETTVRDLFDILWRPFRWSGELSSGMKKTILYKKKNKENTRKWSSYATTLIHRRKNDVKISSSPRRGTTRSRYTCTRRSAPQQKSALRSAQLDIRSTSGKVRRHANKRTDTSPRVAVKLNKQ